MLMPSCSMEPIVAGQLCTPASRVHEEANDRVHVLLVHATGVEQYACAVWAVSERAIQRQRDTYVCLHTATTLVDLGCNRDL